MKYLIPPWKHQLAGIEACRTHPNFAFFWEMGTGKTSTVVNVCREKYYSEKRVLKTLILCPLIVVRNWQKEWAMHSTLPAGKVIAPVGTGKQKVATLESIATENVVCITNYESLENDRIQELLKAWAPEILVCDESQRLKNAQSVRAKRVAELLNEKATVGTVPVRYERKVRHCYLLSGTPILNTAMDIFFPYRILDSGETFGRNFFQFRSRFFFDANSGMPKNIHFPKWIPRPTTHRELKEKIYNCASRVLKKDCLDLPAIVRKTIEVELSDEQRRLYNQMKKDFITWIQAPHGEPQAIVAQMAITKLLRLQQIVSGFVKADDSKEYSIKSNPRIKVLEGLLEELTPQNKVIVWATFHHNYAAIAKACERLKVKYVELHGGIGHAEKNANIEAFQKNPETRVIIANQRSAGLGVNLVESPEIVGKGSSSYSIFYSKGFSLDDDKQAESRNHRGGAEVYESVTRIDLVAPGTIDELITQALSDKQTISNQVLEWTNRI